MKQLNAMGTRRHYYRTAAAAAAAASRMPATQQQQQTVQPIPGQHRSIQQNQTSSSLIGTRNSFELNETNSSNNNDMLNMGLVLNNNNSGSIGMNNSTNYMHPGKVPYNMYLF